MNLNREKTTPSFTSTTPNRMPYWDNVKGVLIILVVLGHLLWGYRECRHTLFSECVYFIYLFHMPAFVFVSGYFSRSANSLKLESVAKLFIAFLLLNFLMMPYAVLIEHARLSLVSLYYSSWYLWALVLYRITLPAASRIPYIVPLSIVASLCVGLWKELDGVFMLPKIVTLYPFFLVGVKSSTEGMTSFIRFLKRHPGWIGLSAILVGSLAVYAIHGGQIGEYDVVYVAYTGAWGMLKRFCLLSVAGVAICGLLSLTSEEIIPFVNKWGKNSLSLYVTHRIFALVFLLVLPAATVQPIDWVWIMVATCASLLILGSDYVARMVHGALSFFVDCYFHKERCKHRGVWLAGTLSLPCMILGVMAVRGIPSRYVEKIKPRVPWVAVHDAGDRMYPVISNEQSLRR